MNCPKCSNSMAPLFTSFYCPHCEKKEQAISASPQYPYTWYIAARHDFSLGELIGKTAKLFSTVENLFAFYGFTSANYRNTHKIVKVYSIEKLEEHTKHGERYPVVGGNPEMFKVCVIEEVQC